VEREFPICIDETSRRRKIGNKTKIGKAYQQGGGGATNRQTIPLRWWLEKKKRRGKKESGTETKRLPSQGGGEMKKKERLERFQKKRVSEGRKPEKVKTSMAPR